MKFEGKIKSCDNKINYEDPQKLNADNTTTKEINQKI